MSLGQSQAMRFAQSARRSRHEARYRLQAALDHEGRATIERSVDELLDRSSQLLPVTPPSYRICALKTPKSWAFSGTAADFEPSFETNQFTQRGTKVSEQYLLTTDEAARALAIGRTGIYALMQRGELASIKVGGSRRIPVKAIEQFISTQLEGEA